MVLHRKDTRLWVLGSKGLPDFAGLRCNKLQRCEGFDKKHRSTFSGPINAKVPLQDRYRIPPRLIDCILNQAEDQIIQHRDEQSMM